MDGWRDARGAAVLLDGDSEEEAEATSGAVVESGRPSTEAVISPVVRPRLAVSSLVIVATFVAGYWAGGRTTAAPGQVRTELAETYVFSGSRLRALSSGGATVWEFDFGRTVVLSDRLDPISVDLEGDGRNEVIIPVRFGVLGARVSDRGDELAAFTETGQRLWAVAFDESLRFGDEQFSGPWQIQALSVERTTPSRVWVAFGHHTWWPSVVLEVSAQGTVRTRFVQAGRVYALAEWVTPSGRYVAAGGVNNEYERPAVAVFPVPDSIDVSQRYHSPQTQEAFRCSLCDGGDPLRYYLLPRSELTAAQGQRHSYVDQVRQVGNVLKVMTDSASGGVFVNFGSDLEPQEIGLADNWMTVHRQLEGRGGLDHQASTCSWPSLEHTVALFTPQGSTEVPVRLRTAIARVR